MASPTCHMLIGPPGCGKSTLARCWVEQFPQTIWVSTDAIRQTLYGDARIQGDWLKIEAELLRQITEAISRHHPVIYDATNIRSNWRIDLLQKLDDTHAQWIGWILQTPLAVCKRRNQMRDRQVNEAVIEQFYRWLDEHPPSISEGFAAIHPVPMKGDEFDFETITLLIQTLQS